MKLETGRISCSVFFVVATRFRFRSRFHFYLFIYFLLLPNISAKILWRLFVKSRSIKPCNNLCHMLLRHNSLDTCTIEHTQDFPNSNCLIQFGILATKPQPMKKTLHPEATVNFSKNPFLA